jgi:vancomycin aglycone glucosyltransferase
VLCDLDAQGWNAMFGAARAPARASIDLPPVDNFRDHIFTDHPSLAADPTRGPWREPTDRGVVRTSGWTARRRYVSPVRLKENSDRT